MVIPSWYEGHQGVETLPLPQSELGPGGETHGDTGASVAPTSEAANGATVPYPWTIMSGDDGMFYFNQETGEAQKELPEGAQATAEVSVPEAEPPPPPATLPLPRGQRRRPCRFFRRGACNLGDACPMYHSDVAEAAPTSVAGKEAVADSGASGTAHDKQPRGGLSAATAVKQAERSPNLNATHTAIIVRQADFFRERWKRLLAELVSVRQDTVAGHAIGSEADLLLGAYHQKAALLVKAEISLEARFSLACSARLLEFAESQGATLDVDLSDVEEAHRAKTSTDAVEEDSGLAGEEAKARLETELKDLKDKKKVVATEKSKAKRARSSSSSSSSSSSKKKKGKKKKSRSSSSSTSRSTKESSKKKKTKKHRSAERKKKQKQEREKKKDNQKDRTKSNRSRRQAKRKGRSSDSSRSSSSASKARTTRRSQTKDRPREEVRAAVWTTTPAPAPVPEPVAQAPVLTKAARWEGAGVMIVGLEKSKELIGCRGVLRRFDGKDRWEVDIAGHGIKKFKIENLRLTPGEFPGEPG